MKQQTIFIIGAVVLAMIGIGFVLMNSMNTTQTTTMQPTPSTVMEKKETTMNTKTIVDIAVENGNFTTLVAAVKAAGLVETLSGKGPFTVFAPTDEAFAKLPAGTVENLLKDPKQLASILTYHVVSGTVMAKDVVTLSEAKTVQGQNVSINVTGDTVMVNEAKVIQTDIEASNGVIHVIDSVILPK